MELCLAVNWTKTQCKEKSYWLLLLYFCVAFRQGYTKITKFTEPVNVSGCHELQSFFYMCCNFFQNLYISDVKQNKLNLKRPPGAVALFILLSEYRVQHSQLLEWKLVSVGCFMSIIWPWMASMNSPWIWRFFKKFAVIFFNLSTWFSYSPTYHYIAEFVFVSQTEMMQEILMLLAKIRYALGDHQGALDRLEEVALDSLPLRDISSRKMKLIGECFAIKGLRLKKNLLHGRSVWTHSGMLCL